MGEISEALGRARKESEGRQHATRAGHRPVSRDSDGDETNSNPSGEPFDSDVAEAQYADSSEPSGTSEDQVEAQTSPASIAAAARESRPPVARAPSGDFARLRDMTEPGRESNRPATPTISTSAAPPSVYRHEIPKTKDDDWVARLCLVDPQGPEAVRFRHLAVKVRSMLDQRSRRSILVTSALPGEGKTTVAVNLALALASIAPEYRVALVDMDLRRGRVAGVLGYASPVGLDNVLSGAVSLDEARVETEMPSLDFYPISRHLPDAHRVLGDAAKKILDDLNRKYDYVVIDGPPVLPVPDIPLLAPQVGGSLVVVASGQTRQAAFGDLLEHLPRHQIMGVFLNRNRSAVSNSRYGYYEAVAVEAEEANPS